MYTRFQVHLGSWAASHLPIRSIRARIAARKRREGAPVCCLHKGGNEDQSLGAAEAFGDLRRACFDMAKHVSVQPRADAMTLARLMTRPWLRFSIYSEASAYVMSGIGPPPSQWQLDSPTPGRALAKSGALALAGKVEDVSNAWKNVKGITDGGKGVDLYDLLSQSVRDTQYSLQHPGVSHQ